MSTPSCDITINNDNLIEQDETFSLSATILNVNGQTVQFTAGGDSASATILDDDGMWFVYSAKLNLLPTPGGFHLVFATSIDSKC